MAKKSETLTQRNKAQRDLIELKKMQAGVLETGPKPSEEAVMPKTVKEKTENFFYHYKYVVALVAFLAVVVTVLTVNMLNRVSYDSKVVVFSYDMSYSLYNERIAEYFETLYSDVNGNGKVEIAAIDCSVSVTEYNEMTTVKLTKLNSMLAVDDDTLIFLMDSDSIKHFTDNLELELFKTENAVQLGDDFYEFICEDGAAVSKTKLFAIMREVEGTAIEDKNKEAYDAALLVMEELRERTVAE